jgi:hypothetical protein
MTELPANADTTAERVTARAPRRSLRAQAAELRMRYDALPRNRQWLVLGALVLVGYLAVDELVWSFARNWASQSEQIEAALDRGAKRASTVSTDLRRSVATFGPIDPPGPAAPGREELARAIDDVMRKHKAGGYSYEARNGQRVKDPDSGILGPAIDRLQADVKFEILDTELPKLVADLESNPVIDGITSLRLQKNDQNRKITVQATIEAWVLSAGGRGGR